MFSIKQMLKDIQSDKYGEIRKNFNVIIFDGLYGFDKLKKKIIVDGFVDSEEVGDSVTIVARDLNLTEYNVVLNEKSDVLKVYVSPMPNNVIDVLFGNLEKGFIVKDIFVDLDESLLKITPYTKRAENFIRLSEFVEIIENDKEDMLSSYQAPIYKLTFLIKESKLSFNVEGMLKLTVHKRKHVPFETEITITSPNFMTFKIESKVDDDIKFFVKPQFFATSYTTEEFINELPEIIMVDDIIVSIV